MATTLRDTLLSQIVPVSTGPDGTLREARPTGPLAVDTTIGRLIPQHDFSGERRRTAPSLGFHEDGSPARIALHAQTLVETPAGRLPAEMATFHPNGCVRAVFPLNGRLDGAWSEEDEYGLAVPLRIETRAGVVEARLISIRFFDNGALHSLTLWPQERVTVQTPFGPQLVRNGLSFHPDGSLRSFEPAMPAELETPLGAIRAFDASAVAVTGDRNSVVLGRDGRVASLATSHQSVVVKMPGGSVRRFEPTCGRDPEDGDLFFLPLRLDFAGGTVRFNGREAHALRSSDFHVLPFEKPAASGCADCATCGRCAAG